MRLAFRRLPRPKYDAALPTLRRRTSRLIASLPARARAFIRLVPLLLEARFRRPSLDTEPPGLTQPPRRRRWGRLCEQLELPPPTSFSQRRPLVASVILAPTAGGGFALLIVPVEGLGAMELQRVSHRVEALTQLAVRHAPTLEVRMAGPVELTPALFAWAAVIAGDVPTLPDSPALDWHDAFARAPTPLLHCLMLLVPTDAPSPLSLIRATHVPSAATAFVACWSANPVARDLLALEGKSLSPAEASRGSPGNSAPPACAPCGPFPGASGPGCARCSGPPCWAGACRPCCAPSWSGRCGYATCARCSTPRAGAWSWKACCWPGRAPSISSAPRP